MTNREIPGDRERVEVRPGVWLWLSGPELAAFHARPESDASKPITSGSVSAPENAALVMPKPRRSGQEKPRRPSARKGEG